MAYNNIIDRDDAAASIPEDVTSEIWKNAVTQSATMQMFRNVPMSRKQQRIPVLSVLPTAYFVNGDSGLKQTSEVNWTNKYLNAEELAVIVPIPEAVLDDSEWDLWAEAMPLIAEAMGVVIDAAVISGTGAPSTWPTGLAPLAVSAGNDYTRTTNAAAAGGIAEDLNQLMMLVEADGFDVSGFIAGRRMKGKLRSARATDGQKLIDVSTSEIEGAPVRYTANSVWPTPATDAAEMIAGDMAHGIFGVRQDMTWKVLDQAVIQDNAGNIIYNLAQQDMVALRAVFRCAWQVPNPVTLDQATEANRFPFGVLVGP